MKSIGSGLLNHLRNNDKFLVADLYQITTVTGTTVYWTNAEANIGSYSAIGPLIKRGKVRLKVGLEVDSLDVTIGCGETTLFNAKPLPQCAAEGVFDGARVRLSRVVMPTFGDLSLGEIVLFSGRVSSVEPSHSEVRFNVKSDLELLNQKMPRNVYCAGCSHSLYGTGCGVNKNSYQTSGYASSGDTTYMNTNLYQSTGYYDQGFVQFTSGALYGITRTVKSYTSGRFDFSLPLPSSAAGCSFIAWPGCDKTLSTCQNRFNNATRFRGYPWLPKPEAAR